MSYFIPGAEAQEIDWMTLDLLAACSDPMFENMGLDGLNVEYFSEAAPPCSEPHLEMLHLAEPNPEAQAQVLPPEPSMVNNVPSRGAQSSSMEDANETSHAIKYETVWHCHTCGQKFYGDWDLSSHGRKAGHPAFRCIFAGCNQLFQDYRERDAHQKRTHVSGHGRVAMSNPNACVECETSCETKADLLRHAKVLQHQPYGCECGARFSRLDVLNRHLDSYSESEPEYPCKYCKRHRGANGFRRQDHLMQHIRNYHHHETDSSGENAALSARLPFNFPTCPHSDCPQHRGDDYHRLPRLAQLQSKPFTSQSAFTKHMREEHHESTFPCDILGCGRVGRRGYFREKDLIKHRKEQHPDADAYQVTNRDTRVKCLEPQCGVWLDPSSLRDHYGFIHRQHPYYEKLPTLTQNP